MFIVYLLWRVSSFRVQCISINEPISDSPSKQENKGHISHSVPTSGLIWRPAGNFATLLHVVWFNCVNHTQHSDFSTTVPTLHWDFPEMFTVCKDRQRVLTGQQYLYRLRKSGRNDNKSPITTLSMTYLMLPQLKHLSSCFWSICVECCILYPSTHHLQLRNINWWIKIYCSLGHITWPHALQLLHAHMVVWFLFPKPQCHWER